MGLSFFLRERKQSVLKMGNRVKLWVVLVLCFAVSAAMGKMEEGGKREKEKEEGRESSKESLFLLQNSKHVIKTDAGEMKVVKGFNSHHGGSGIVERPMHIGFITMEPKSLFVPQYLDSSLIIFIRRGEARLGSIYEDELAEKVLKTGDVYRIPAGSAFYLVNTGEGQRLHVICSIDTLESLGAGVFQSFFIGGGSYPTSILAGFDTHTLAAALNVSTSELKTILTTQEEGPIVFIPDSHSPSIWANFLQQKQHERLQHLKRMVAFEEKSDDDDDDCKKRWSWRKLLNSVFGEDDRKDKVTRKSPDSYNIYNRRPDFRNNYGWSVALDEHEYKPLKHSGIGIYLVNLTAGSMMAPHVNPTATEYGVVLRGSGSIQIVFPNGTSAMNAQVKEGDVFWVPRYFSFCQIASRTGPFEFFGFTTSARRNRPQFLAGSSSLLHTMRGPEIAAAFGVNLETYDRIINAQKEAIILPTAAAAPPDEKKMPKLIKSFSGDMILGV